MKVDELIRNSRMVIDSTGKTEAVQIDYVLWEELIETLETLENNAKVDRVESESKDSVDNQDGDWVTKKLNEIYAEEDSSLHPDLAAMQWDALPKEDWS